MAGNGKRLWKVIRGDQQYTVLVKIFSPLPLYWREEVSGIKKGKMKNFEGTTVTPPVSLANRRVGFVLESFNGLWTTVIGQSIVGINLKLVSIRLDVF